MASPALRLARLILTDPDRARTEAQRIEEQASKRRRRVLAKSRDRRVIEVLETAKERAHRAAVYSAVDHRSQGMCELGDGLLNCHNEATEHDHFWGRGKAKETPENVWHLCRAHHQHKTDNQPSRKEWLILFRFHCMFKGFRSELAKVDRALALENAQHPPTPRE